MRDYEMMVILHPELDAAQLKGMIETLQTRLARDGEVARVDLIGRRRLAYPMGKVHQGIYVLANFSFPPSAIDGLKQWLRVDCHETVVQHLLLIDEKRGIRPPSQPLPSDEPAVEAAAELEVDDTVHVVLDGDEDVVEPAQADEEPVAEA
jgi:small subunit ribosomal protein S6